MARLRTRAWGAGRGCGQGGDEVAVFVLIHGAADVGWYWHLVERELRARGHETTAPDLPCEDDAAGLAEYADTVARAAGRLRGSDLVVVAQSFGGFTAPLVAARLRARATGHRHDPGSRREGRGLARQYRPVAGHCRAGCARRRQDRQ